MIVLNRSVYGSKLVSASLERIADTHTKVKKRMWVWMCVHGTWLESARKEMSVSFSTSILLLLLLLILLLHVLLLLILLLILLLLVLLLVRLLLLVHLCMVDLLHLLFSGTLRRIRGVRLRLVWKTSWDS
jgi:hypothetical protein